jgi:hypothetical protein
VPDIALSTPYVHVMALSGIQWKRVDFIFFLISWLVGGREVQ